LAGERKSTVHKDPYILVFAPNEMGLGFLETLRNNHFRFAAISINNKLEEHLIRCGVHDIWHINLENNRITFPEQPVRKIFLFEDKLKDCFQLLQIIRNWTSGSIYVITETNFTSKIYKELGANFVIHTNSKDVSFLIG
jgi:hypothetical protein